MEITSPTNYRVIYQNYRNTAISVPTDGFFFLFFFVFWILLAKKIARSRRCISWITVEDTLVIEFEINNQVFVRLFFIFSPLAYLFSVIEKKPIQFITAQSLECYFYLPLALLQYLLIDKSSRAHFICKLKRKMIERFGFGMWGENYEAPAVFKLRFDAMFDAERSSVFAFFHYFLIRLAFTLPAKVCFSCATKMTEKSS